MSIGVLECIKNKWGQLLLVFATAFLIFIFVSRSVIIVYDSTLDYLHIIDSLVHRSFGYEFIKLLGTEYAPIYILYLAILKNLFSNFILAYEIISVGLFLLNGVIILKLLGNMRDQLARFGLTIISLFFIQFIHIYLFMLSEGLMLTLILSYIYLNDISANKRFIVLQNILIVLSFLVKYSSFVIIIGIFLSEILLRKTSLLGLIKSYFPSLLIISLWLLYSYTQKGNFTGDTFQYKRLLVDCIIDLHTHLNKFIFPYTYIPIIALAFYARLSLNWILALIVYLFFILFFDYTGRLVLDERILIPIYIFLILIVRDLYQYSTNIIYINCYKLFLLASTMFTLFRFAKNYLFWLSEY